MTEEEIDAAVDELMALAEEQGKKLRAARGLSDERDPRFPGVGNRLRSALRASIIDDLRRNQA